MNASAQPNYLESEEARMSRENGVNALRETGSPATARAISLEDQIRAELIKSFGGPVSEEVVFAQLLHRSSN